MLFKDLLSHAMVLQCISLKKTLFLLWVNDALQNIENALTMIKLIMSLIDSERNFHLMSITIADGRNK